MQRGVRRSLKRLRRVVSFSESKAWSFYICDGDEGTVSSTKTLSIVYLYLYTLDCVFHDLDF
jgi:hypothetical protein